MWLLSYPWNDLSSSSIELVTSLSHSAIIKDNIELVISAGAEIGRSLGIVMEVGDIAVQTMVRGWRAGWIWCRSF